MVNVTEDDFERLARGETIEREKFDAIASDPELLAKAAQYKTIRGLFENSGFSRVLFDETGSSDETAE